MSKQYNILVTGGAGFIGSNIVKRLLSLDKVKQVRVLDNFSTGHRKNIEPFLSNPKFEFIWGDIREYSTCLECVDGIDMVCHQAALGSVPRSIKAPLTTNNVNITGALNVFTAAKESGIKRVVYAASSSTYGGNNELPKVEDKIGSPLSPYAVTKFVNELYADVYASLYDMEFVGLRYFNVFGQQQDPNGAYAAVIPLFFKMAINEVAPKINGDGSYSRDFTFIENVVQANLLALFTEDKTALNEVYNIACGERTSLNELWAMIQEITNTSVQATYGPTRAGDVPHSLADISKAGRLLSYKGEVKVKEGLQTVYSWYKENL